MAAVDVPPSELTCDGRTKPMLQLDSRKMDASAQFEQCLEKEIGLRDVKRTSHLPSPHHVVTLTNCLSEEECVKLVQTAEEVGFHSLASEFPPDYRNNTRLIALNETFAHDLWTRIVPHLETECISVRPCGFGNEGVWVPIRLNECIKFGRYLPGEKFAPHVDGPWIPRSDETSIMTVIFYLNHDYEGGETQFLEKPDSLPTTAAEAAQVATAPLLSYKAQVGSVLIFPHDMLHQGLPVLSGVKHIMRTEIMYRCVTKFHQTVPYKSDPKYVRALKMYRKSFEYQKELNVEGFTNTYLEALKLQAAQADVTASVVSNQESLEPLTHDLLVYIMSFLDLTSISACMKVCRQFYTAARDPRVWYRLYATRWPTVLELPNCFPMSRDWYDAYRSRVQTFPYMSSVVIDAGSHSIKTACLWPNQQPRFFHDLAQIAIIDGLFDIHLRRGEFDRYFVGETARQHVGDEGLSRIIINGKPVNTDTMCEAVCLCFGFAKSHPRLTPTVLIEPPQGWDAASRRHIFQSVVVACGACRVLTFKAPLMSMLFNDLDEGIVLSVGHDLVCASAVVSGNVVACEYEELSQGRKDGTKTIFNYGTRDEAHVLREESRKRVSVDMCIGLITTLLNQCETQQLGARPCVLLTGGRTQDDAFRIALQDGLSALGGAIDEVHLSKDPTMDCVAGAARLLACPTIPATPAWTQRSVPHKKGRHGFYYTCINGYIGYWFEEDMVKKFRTPAIKDDPFLFWGKRAWWSLRGLGEEIHDQVQIAREERGMSTSSYTPRERSYDSDGDDSCGE
eukprot:m.93018 g.93018  ORF g.93018 m.93018 type:complete len:791 (+) comp12994_c0_seq3:163-2535(+)